MPAYDADDSATGSSGAWRPGPFCTFLILNLVLCGMASAQVLERSEGATRARPRGACALYRGGEVRCSSQNAQRRFRLPEATSIEVIHDSLYWLERSGDLLWIERWQDPTAPVTLVDGAARTPTARLEGAGTSPPSPIFEFNPHHLLCVRDETVRCWAWRAGYESRARAASSVREVAMPENPRRVRVGPPLVVQREDGSIAVLDRELRSWLEFSDARFSPRLRARRPPPDVELLRANRQRFTVRLGSGELVACNVHQRILCGPDPG